MRSTRWLAVAALGLTVAAGCRPHAVSVRFDPQVGQHYGYRYDVKATLTRTIAGAETKVTHVDTRLHADQEVLARTRGGARVRVRLTRDGGASSTVIAVIDRAGSLAGVELVEGLDAAVFGIGDPSGLAPDPAEGLPSRPLAPGDRWAIADEGRTGHGRLERLGVVKGHDVATARTTQVESLGGQASTVVTNATGRVHSGSLTSYDLDDGAVRSGRSWAHGRLTGNVQPPANVVAEPVQVTVTYDVEVRVTRTR